MHFEMLIVHVQAEKFECTLYHYRLGKLYGAVRIAIKAGAKVIFERPFVS